MQSENQQTSNNALFASFIWVYFFFIFFRINNNASAHDNARTATNTTSSEKHNEQRFEATFSDRTCSRMENFRPQK